MIEQLQEQKKERIQHCCDCFNLPWFSQGNEQAIFLGGMVSIRFVFLTPKPRPVEVRFLSVLLQCIYYVLEVWSGMPITKKVSWFLGLWTQAINNVIVS